MKGFIKIESNIHQNESSGTFMVHKKVGGKNYKKTFKTIEEARKYKSTFSTIENIQYSKDIEKALIESRQEVDFLLKVNEIAIEALNNLSTTTVSKKALRRINLLKRY